MASLPRFQTITPAWIPQSASGLFRTLLIVLSVIGAGMFVVNTVIVVAVSPRSGALGLVFTALYLLIGLWLTRLSPMYPKRTPASFQTWWIISCLVWGGGVCMTLAMLSDPLNQLVRRTGWDAAIMSWGGAYPEEISKALGVAVILLSFKHLTRPWHGAITGLLIGLGFETNENVGYGGFGATADPNSDLVGTLTVWGQRMLAGAGLHMITTALAGWGIGWAIFAAHRSLGRRIGFALACFFGGFAIHFVWNYTTDSIVIDGARMIIVALIMYGALIALFSHGNDLARREQTGPCTPRSETELAADDDPRAVTFNGHRTYTRSKVADTSSASDSTD